VEHQKKLTAHYERGQSQRQSKYDTIMKNILITIDYSPNSQKVADFGLLIAKSMHANIHLLHVISCNEYYLSSIYSPIMGFGGYINSSFLEPESIDELTRESYQYLSHVKEELDINDIETIVRKGKVTDIILEVIKEKDIDAVVVGSYTHKWLEETFSGSTAHDLLKYSKVPIITVPLLKGSKY
jgi:nucleotide-binding universal stress UspA family protein